MCRKRIPEQRELWKTLGVAVHADDVEPPLRRTRNTAQELAGDISDVTFFLLVHRCLGRLDVVGGARLHFDEAQDVAVPANQVNFAVGVRRTVVAGDHDVAESTEIEVGVFFAALTGKEMVRSLGRPQYPFCGLINYTDHDVG